MREVWGAIGISTGGQISLEGRVLSATDTISDWAGLDLAGQLRDHFSLPVSVINDGHAATLAEAHYGAGKDHRAVLGLLMYLDTA